MMLNGIEGTTTNMCGLHRMPLDQAMHRLVILSYCTSFFTLSSYQVRHDVEWHRGNNYKHVRITAHTPGSGNASPGDLILLHELFPRCPATRNDSSVRERARSLLAGTYLFPGLWSTIWLLDDTLIDDRFRSFSPAPSPQGSPCICKWVA